jgi:hypothetical protein
VGKDLDRIHHIAWLDLLGFRELLAKESLVDVVALLRDQVPASVAGMTTEIRHVDGRFEQRGRVCEVEQFQDTLVLWTKERDFASLDSLVHVVEIVVAVLHMKGLPCRGAISKGTLYTARLDPSLKKPGPAIVVGAGVLAAAELEKKHPWAGVVLDERETLMADEDWRNALADLTAASGSSGRVHRYAGLPNSDAGVLSVGWPFPLKDKRPDEIVRAMWPRGPPTESGARLVYHETAAFLHWWMSPTQFGLDFEKLNRSRNPRDLRI